MPTSAPDLTQIETPAVLLDLDQLLENARSVQRAADSRGIEVRPHVKTHKCVAIAKLQIEEGATGVTASKTDEALQFISGGIQSVTVAYPIVVPAKLDRLIETAASHEAELRIIFDSETGVEAIAEATRRHATTVGVLLKVDVGLHRCGLQEDDPRLIPLVKKVAGDESLRFLGLLSHAGQAYAAPDAESVRQIAKQECEMLGRIRRKLEGEGIEVPIISVGSTPTVMRVETSETPPIPRHHRLPPITPVPPMISARRPLSNRLPVTSNRECMITSSTTRLPRQTRSEDSTYLA